jgi:hypothetical protein
MQLDIQELYYYIIMPLRIYGCYAAVSNTTVYQSEV